MAQRIHRPGEPETDRLIKRLQRVGDVAGTGSRFEALALPGAEKGHDRRFPFCHVGVIVSQVAGDALSTAGAGTGNVLVGQAQHVDGGQL